MIFKLSYSQFYIIGAASMLLLPNFIFKKIAFKYYDLFENTDDLSFRIKDIN